MFCPQCGAQTNDNDAFCPMCGASVGAATPTAPEPSVPPPAPPQPAAPQPPAVPQQPAVAPVAYAGALYAKAPLGARFLAVLADGIIGSALLPLGILLAYADILNGQAPVLGGVIVGIASLWQIAYTLGRDGARGAGFGKRMTGLTVVSAQTGAPTGIGASIARQLILWLLGIVPVIGSLVEPILVIADKDGRRLGDKAAKTQVARSSEVAARGFPVATGKSLAIVMLVVALLASIAGGVVGGVVFAKAVQEAADGGIIDIVDSSLDTLAEDTSVDEGSTTLAESTPEQTVDDFYLAAASGDFDAVVKTFSEELAYYSDPAMFEGWTIPSYEIVDVTDVEEGLANVTVEELDGGMSDGSITYILVFENGTWKIDDWVAGGVEGDVSSDDDLGTVVLNAETATDAVGTLLVALSTDDIDTMRSVSTDYFQDAQSWFFAPSAGAFIDFEIVDNFPDGAAWIVGVQEDWNSGPEETFYIVIEQDGRVVVDDLYYE